MELGQHIVSSADYSSLINRSMKLESLQAIQAKLLTVVQDLENTSWMFPEPLPFLSSIPQPSSTIGHKMPTTLPFHNHDFTSGNTWADKAFNPLSTFVPRAPEGQASWPDSYRVHRALGGLSSSENDMETERRGNEGRARYHMNAIPRREPDFTWLEAEAENILGDQDKSFAAKAKFPWATALSSSSNGGKVQGVNGQHDVKIREGSMARGGSTSLTREVGIIRLS